MLVVRRLAAVAGVLAAALVNTPAAHASYDTTVTADSPSVYWRLGEQAGASAQDETASNNDGTYLGGVLLGAPGAADDENTSVVLNGVNYVRVGNAAALNPATGITLEAWVKPTAGGFGTSKPVVEKGFTSWAAPYFQYTLRLYDSGAAPQNVSFSLAVAGVKRDLDVNSAFRLGVWNHVVATMTARICGSTKTVFRLRARPRPERCRPMRRLSSSGARRMETRRLTTATAATLTR